MTIAQFPVPPIVKTVTVRAAPARAFALFADDLARCRKILPASCHILFAFSSTEIPTIFQWFVPHDWQPDSVRLPIGHARPGMDYKIDTDGSADGAGELVVRSRYLALGYWQGGQLQKGPFEVDPADPALRILHTGDRIRLPDNGLAEMTGRRTSRLARRGACRDLAHSRLSCRGGLPLCRRLGQ